jgi:hypothetical protein
VIKSLQIRIFAITLHPQMQKTITLVHIKNLKKVKDYECSTSCRAAETALS